MGVTLTNTAPGCTVYQHAKRSHKLNIWSSSPKQQSYVPVFCDVTLCTLVD